jgi:hypothetical protein
MFKGIELFFTLAAAVGGPLLAIMVVPALAKRLLGKTARWPGEAPRAELDDMRERLSELDDMARRVAELEERVDFAERLLAQQREAALPKPRA